MLFALTRKFGPILRHRRIEVEQTALRQHVRNRELTQHTVESDGVEEQLLLETTILNQGLHPALKALGLPKVGCTGFGAVAIGDDLQIFRG